MGRPSDSAIYVVVALVVVVVIDTVFLSGPEPAKQLRVADYLSLSSPLQC